MTDDQGRVLEMLSEGKISVDEAERLLAALVSGNSGTWVGSGASETRRVGLERFSVVLEADSEADVQDSYDDTFEVGESPRVVVNNVNGNVRCEVGQDNAVRVQATLRNAEAVDYRAVQKGDTITVDVKTRGTRSLLGFLGRSGRTDLIVISPRRSGLELKVMNGAIEADGFEGAAAASAQSGKITLIGCDGAVRARSTNGAIDLENARGSIDAATMNGPLNYAGEMLPGSENRLKTMNGQVRVTLLGTPSLRIDASCSHGRISSEFPGLTVSGQVGRRLEGTLGDGEAKLAVRTMNGSISIVGASEVIKESPEVTVEGGPGAQDEQLGHDGVLHDQSQGL